MAKLKYKNGDTWTEISLGKNYNIPLDAWPVGVIYHLTRNFSSNIGTPGQIIGGTWSQHAGTTGDYWYIRTS